MHASVQDESFKLNLSDIALRQDPAREFTRIRERGPVIHGKMPLMGKAWFATSWESVVHVLRNAEAFVREPRHAGRKSYSWIQWMMPSMFNRLSQNMLTRDAEDHRRLRMLVDQAFQRQSIERMAPRLAAITEEHLDEIERTFASGEPSVDFIPTFLRPYPLAVICELLGLPDSDRPRFMQWFSGMSQVSN